MDGTSWFKKPALEMELVTVCTRSGQRNSEECDKVDTISVNHVGLQTSMCTYHKSVYLSADGKYRVHSGCTSLANAKKASWFVLPPLQEYYYRSKNISYLPLPPFRDDCITTTHQSVMEMVYPKDNAKLFLPRTPSGEAGSVILELAHSYRDVVAYWHLDGDFIGATENAHRLVVQPSFGKHSLMVIDQFGEAISLNFEVISKM
jgi:penicillin-binding protein 1C